MSNIATIIREIDGDSFGANEVERSEALEAAYQLVHRLERPRDAITRWVHVQPSTHMALCVAVDLELFKHLALQSPRSIQELADLTTADASFLLRILRMLASVCVVTQVDHVSFSSNELTCGLATSECAGAIRFGNNVMWPYRSSIPAFYQKFGYRCSIDPRNCAWNDVAQTKSTFFEWLSARPESLADFTLFASAYASSQEAWCNWTPVRSWLDGADLNPNKPVFVDVGGSIGRDVKALLQLHPDLSGRLVCQDLPDVVALAEPVLGIEFMAHDIFKPQPIHGANVYFLHSILHDWPDAEAQKILLNIRPAMHRGHSRLVIHDQIMPHINIHSHLAASDLLMMDHLGAMERTTEQWAKLFDVVGMKLDAVFQSARNAHQVMVVELAAE